MKHFFTFSFIPPKIRTFLLFSLIVFIAFAMRTHNYNREAAAIAKIIGDRGVKQQSFLGQFLPVTHLNFIPYSIECAMMYGYIQDIAAGKGVPASDKNLHGLEDIAPYRQMIMGLEYFVGYSYRLKSLLFKDPAPTPAQRAFQDNVYLAQWTAFQLRLWIAFSSGFIFLLLKILHCKTSLAFFGGLLHAVAIGAIARSTGQDIIRGSFALPMLSAMLLLLYTCYLKGKNYQLILLGIVSFIAFSTWDLSLGVFSALAIYEICRYLVSGRISLRRKKAWIVLSCAVVTSSLFIPFNQTYQTIMSPLCVILLPTLIFCCCLKKTTFGKRLLLLLIVGSTLFLFWNFAVKTPHYVSHYSHFGELTRAKLKFNNIKPKDPSKLSYDARMMWTPAMHSATWKILTTYFPSLGSVSPSRFIFKSLNNLILNVPLALGLFYLLLLLGPFSRTAAGVIKRNLPRNLFFYVFTVVFTVGFIYIVRYHEFLILFLAVSLPLMLSDISESIRLKKEQLGSTCRKTQKMLALLKITLKILCICILLLEVIVSLFGKRNYSGEIAMHETARLIAWFRQEKIPGKCVITDFSLGPMLKCYAGTAIALQPQFGLERIRRPVEEYLKELFHGTEESLLGFCRKLKGDFLVFHKGYTGPMHIYSDRYIANAKKIRPTAPVNLMRYAPQQLAWFFPVEVPPGLESIKTVYTVFRIIYPEDRLKAAQLCFQAQEYFRKGNKRLAQRLIRSAFMLDPASELIRITYFKICSHVPRLGLNSIRRPY